MSVLATLGAWAFFAAGTESLPPEGQDFVRLLRESQGIQCIIDATEYSGHGKRHRALLQVRGNGDFILDGGSPSRLSFIDGRFYFQRYHQHEQPLSVHPELERPAWLAAQAIRHGFAFWELTSHPDAPESTQPRPQSPWLELRLPPRYRAANRALIKVRDGWPADAYIFKADEVAWRIQVSHCEKDPSPPEGGFRPDSPSEPPDLKYAAPFPGYHR